MMDIKGCIWNGGELLEQVSGGGVCQMQWYSLPREIHRARQSPFYVREWHILVLNGINWVPLSTLRIVLLLIIRVLGIVVVLDVFLEGNSSNLRIACGAFSLIDHRSGESYFRALSSRLSSEEWLRAPTGQNNFRWQNIWNGLKYFT